MSKYKKLKKLIWNCGMKNVGAQLPTATRMADIEEPEEIILLPCKTCSRTFRPEVLEKHSKVCETMTTKKRKKFDSAKQRLQGTEVTNFPATVKPVKKEITPCKPTPSKWREKQADLSRTLQAAKTQDPKAKIIKPSDHEQCQFCERYFGPKAFDRHVEWCREQHIKIKNNNNQSTEARERLQVRTKYRAPLTNRVLTRDKYMPRSRDASPMNTAKTTDDIKTKFPSPMGRSNSFRISTSRTVVKNVSQRIPENHSKTPSRDLSTSEQKMTKPKLFETPKIYESSKKKVFPHVVRHVIATVLPKRFTIEEADKYDPFASAEQQMMELFGVDNKTAENAEKAISPTSPSSNSNLKNPNSSLSAFAIYTPMNRNSRSFSNENLKIENKENNNIDPLSPLEKIEKRRNFSLSNLSLCSVISLDSLDCNKNAIGNNRLPRSFSAVDKPRISKNKVNMQQMLYGTKSPEPPASPASSSEMGNLEACEAELLISMIEFEKMLNSSPVPSLEPSSPLCSSANEKIKEDDLDRKKQPFVNSLDSAYSSLTRASGDGDTIKSEAARFCHDCGARYPVPMAKFCCNCGMRRIAM